MHQQLRRHEFAGAAEGDTPGLDVISRDVMSSEPAADDKRSALDEPDTESPTTTTAVQSKARELGRYRSNRRRIDSGLIMSFFSVGRRDLKETNTFPTKFRRNLAATISCGCKIMPSVCCAMNLQIRTVVSMSQ